MTLSKNLSKHIRLLHKKKYRDKHNEFIAEGKKIVSDFLNSALKVKYIVCTPEWKNSFRDSKVEVLETTTEEFKKISSQSNAAGILAVVEKRENSADLTSSDIILVLDSIRDPGNLGTIIRTADWFGIKHVVCSPDSVDCYNPKVVQSTMGSLARVNTFYSDLPQYLNTISEKFTIYGTFLDGEPLPVEKSNIPIAIVIGSESHGISSDL
ncbi:MAG: RNA methyltransferase, partial [Bacteroidota bacterium]|nr:RNA methyltransferase [Bacteroidota bacterium]